MNTSKNGHEDTEGDETYPVLYVFVFAFHPKLIRDRFLIQRSFGYSLQQFLIYLGLCFPGFIPLLQKCLKDVAIRVSQRKSSNTHFKLSLLN